MKFFRIINKLRHKIFCPATSIAVSIGLSILIFLSFTQKTTYEKNSADVQIKSKIDNIVNECGKDYWVSWLVLDESPFVNRYRFIDILGCNPTDKVSCTFSVKDAKLNIFYDRSHMLDEKSANLIQGIPSGRAYLRDNIEDFKDYAAIYEALTSSNKKIEQVGIAVARGFIIKGSIKTSVVYAFALTRTSKDNIKCDKNKITNILEELSLYAESVI